MRGRSMLRSRTKPHYANQSVPDILLFADPVLAYRALLPALVKHTPSRGRANFRTNRRHKYDGSEQCYPSARVPTPMDKCCRIFCCLTGQYWRRALQPVSIRRCAISWARVKYLPPRASHSSKLICRTCVPDLRPNRYSFKGRATRILMKECVSIQEHWNDTLWNKESVVLLRNEEALDEKCPKIWMI